MGTMKPFVYVFVAISFSALAALAQSESAIGRLTCNLMSEFSEAGKYPEADFECEFRAVSGDVETYAAQILAIGEGLQVENRVVLVWDVFTNNASIYEKGRMRGSYIGGSDAIELDNGILAHYLLIREEESFDLLPISFTGIVAGSRSVRIQLMTLR